ncbi:hypothetical protein FRC02_003808 [Tulasnella sp. 418]|nr:hypothetical protein FRC02_003808 [Tulasnella sp. 418]
MGNLYSVGFFGQIFPPASKFDVDRDIPDLTGKAMIVTGGNTGIGRETVKALLKKNAKVYMASRSKERAERAIAELKAETGKEAIFLHLDLSDLDSARRAANEFKSKESELHVLFNSAGIMWTPVEMVTEDDYDLQFYTNVLGPAHFTLCLIPELIAGAKTSGDGKARVIHTSSNGAYLVGDEGVQYDTLRGKDNPNRYKMGTKQLYYQTKFGNVLFSNELAKRHADQGIISNSVNPGGIRTELQRYAGSMEKFLLSFVTYPAPFGALTQLWGGVSPETKDFNGQFLVPWARLGTAGRYVKKPGEGEKLWEWIEEQRKGH